MFLSHDEVLRFEWKSLQNDDMSHSGILFAFWLYCELLKTMDLGTLVPEVFFCREENISLAASLSVA